MADAACAIFRRGSRGAGDRFHIDKVALREESVTGFDGCAAMPGVEPRTGLFLDGHRESGGEK